MIAGHVAVSKFKRLPPIHVIVPSVSPSIVHKVLREDMKNERKYFAIRLNPICDGECGERERERVGWAIKTVCMGDQERNSNKKNEEERVE